MSSFAYYAAFPQMLELHGINYKKKR